jgi:hypothetical protein
MELSELLDQHGLGMNIAFWLFAGSALIKCSLYKDLVCQGYSLRIGNIRS